MTPKEKAEELYLKMLNWQSDSNKFLETNIISTSAKQCALIAVEQMILVLPFTNTNTSLNEYAIYLQKYLLEVKQEIQNL
jgi:hypothetical protein